MKWTMLVISVLLTGLTGCYSRNFRLIENDMRVSRGQVIALKAENNYLIQLCEKIIDSFRDFKNTVLETAKEIVEFREFKASHDARWPSLVPKEKK